MTKHEACTTKRKDRKKGSFYLHEGREAKWNGYRFLCEHGKQKYQCRDCGGSAFCDHGRRKTYCRDCGGSGLCGHSKRKAECKDCGGWAFCDHGRLKSRCMDCGGAGICEHGRQKTHCRDCGGSAFCEHRRQKSRCKDCGGAGICEHGKNKGSCTEHPCGSIPSANKCIALCGTLVKRVSGVPATHFCASCRKGHGIHALKKYEQQMETWLDDAGLVWSYSNKKLPCAPTTRYPDYLFVASADHVVLLEVDEHEHKDYNPECEIKRISEFMDGIDYGNLHVVRFNPNGGVGREMLLATLRDALATNFGLHNASGCVVQYLGYSEDRVVMLEDLACRLQLNRK